MDNTNVAFIFCSFVTLFSFIWVVRAAFKQSPGWGLAVLLFSPVSTIFLGIARWHEVKRPFLLFMTSFILYAYLAMKLFASFAGMGMVSSVAELTQLTQMQQQGDVSEAEVQARINDILENLSDQVDGKLQKLHESGVISEAELKQYRQQMADSSDMRGESDTSSHVISYDELRNRAIARARQEEKDKVRLVSNTEQKSFQQILQEKNAARDRQRALQAEKIKALHEKVKLRKKTQPPQQTIKLENISEYIGAELRVNDVNDVTHNGILQKVSQKHLEFYKELHGGRFEFRIDKEDIRHIYPSPLASSARDN